MKSRAEAPIPRLLALLLLLAVSACSLGPRPGSLASRKPVADSPVKIGKPYQVQGQWYYPADEPGYDEVGLASWYGDAFHGGPTANGEIFDMNMVGAAHKTLPLPSYVEVTALDTGRTIVVRLNDRGPFVANRIIDLSRRAAQLLGVDRQGVARVRVRRVQPPEGDRALLRSGRPASLRPDASAAELAELDRRFRRLGAPQQAAAAPPAPPTMLAARAPLALDGWFLQLGAFGDPVRAEALAAAIGGSVEGGGSLFRVRTGPYFDEESASAALARLQAQGYQDAKLIRPGAGN
jgi:rare lipoprotein A